MMNDYRWKYCVCCFHFICWIAAVTMVSYWIYKFTLNEDLCRTDYKHYYDTESDEFPVLSLCIKNPISENLLKNYDPELDKERYLSFLNGSYFDRKLLDIDYNKVTIDMSEESSVPYALWGNGSMFQDLNNKRRLFRSTVAFSMFEFFYQCYELQVPKEQMLRFFVVYVNSSALPDRTRPQNYDMLTFLHFPNHLLSSTNSIKYSWPLRKSNDQYLIRYRIKGLEVMKRRNKGSQPCQDWNNYDASILENHIRKVGCRTPYQPLVDDVKLCSTMEEMKNASWSIFNEDYGILPPCKSMDKIYYDYEEMDTAGIIFARKNMLAMGVYFFDKTFKEILQTR